MLKKSAYFALAVVLLSVCFGDAVHAAWGDRLKKNQNNETAQADAQGWGDRMIVKRDLAYGSDPLQKLDIYAPRGQKALKPVLIFIHGGAWTKGSKNQYKPMGRFYANEDVVFVAIDYRLAPAVKHPVLAQDCAAAVKWVYDHISQYGGDPNKLYLSGHSAGAHLSALIATDPKYLNAHGLAPSLFKAVLPNDTASYDFTVPMQKGKFRVQPIIDDTFGTSPEQQKAASPITYARSEKNLPRFVMFVTGKRQDAVAQSHALDEALKQSSAQSEVHVINGKTHREMAYGMFEADSPISQTILKVVQGR